MDSRTIYIQYYTCPRTSKLTGVSVFDDATEAAQRKSFHRTIQTRATYRVLTVGITEEIIPSMRRNDRMCHYARTGHLEVKRILSQSTKQRLTYSPRYECLAWRTCRTARTALLPASCLRTNRNTYTSGGGGAEGGSTGARSPSVLSYSTDEEIIYSFTRSRSYSRFNLLSGSNEMVLRI